MPGQPAVHVLLAGHGAVLQYEPYCVALPKNRPDPLHKVSDCNVRKLPGVSVPHIIYARPESGYP